VGVLLLALALLASVAVPLWRPLLLAGVLAAALASWEDRLAARLGGRRSLAALALVLGVIVLVAGPLATVGAILVKEVVEAVQWLQATFAQGGLDALVALLPERAQGVARAVADRIPSSWEGLLKGAQARGSAAAGIVTSALSSTSSALFDSAMMIIALYFLLVDGRSLVRWIVRTSPLGAETSARIVRELHRTSSSVLTSLLATAAVQGTVAALGYWIAGVPRPLLFGLITLFASFIPSVGTGIVGLPIAVALMLSGRFLAGGFLVVWTLVVTGTIDNVLKPLLARNGVRLHGGVVFFAMIGGILAYGALGLLIGPLAVSLVLALLHVGWQELSIPRDVSPTDAGAAARTAPRPPDLDPLRHDA
jgi:predicted PurR-regulated permease PerM